MLSNVLTTTTRQGTRVAAELSSFGALARRGRRAAGRAVRSVKHRSAARRAQSIIRPPQVELRRPVPVELLRGYFDPGWYVAFYGLHADSPFESPFDHYLALGARLAFSPSPDFDEAAYRYAHRDVRLALRRGRIHSGLHHFVEQGELQGRATFAVSDAAPGSAHHVMHSEHAASVRLHFDPVWYVDHNPDVLRGIARGWVATPLWHYLAEGAHRGLSPNAWFDERWYLRRYRDVAQGKAEGKVVSGFTHYLRYGQVEGRAPGPTADDAFTSLSRPVAINRLANVERKLRPFPFQMLPADGSPRVNFLLPTLDTRMVFGGYHAALHFIRRLQARGWPVRLLITDDVGCTHDRLQRDFEDNPTVSAILTRASFVNLARRAELLDITSDDSFFAYSMWTAHHASLFAEAVGRRFVFFIQEYEPAFHHHDYLHAVGASMYAKPHFALFNSEFLRRYFVDQGIGVFANGGHGASSSVSFEHALAVTPPASVDELVRGSPRRLLVYARPEEHAGRNLFELAVIGLRRAVAAGVFDDDWVFDGVGSLRAEATVSLGGGRVLEIRPKLDVGSYAAALRAYDVGLSLQYSPHPGVVHFEMAASGMAVVTNTFSNRSAEDLREVSENLVPVAPTADDVAEGLRQAVALAADLPARVKHAQGPWVTDWDLAFDDALMERVESELR
jgi:hypothetical protein